MTQRMTHTDACKRALVTLSETGCLVALRPVGLFRDQRGTPRKIGTPGEADIQGTMPGGRSIAVEVKTGRATQSQEQKRWQVAFQSRGGLFVLARYSETSDGDAAIRKAVTRAGEEAA